MGNDVNNDRQIASENESTRRFVNWVRAAAPYVHAFGGRTFVIGFGGEVAAGQPRAGTGPGLQPARRARHPTGAGAWRASADRRRDGAARPDAAHSITACASPMPRRWNASRPQQGVTRLEVEALLSQGLPNTPMAGAYMRVTGGNFITAKPVGVVDGVDYQFTGAVRKVIAEEIAADLDQENVVLMSPVGTSPSGEIFNLSMEEVAEKMAIALQAEKLIFLCDATGVTDAKGRLVGVPSPPTRRSRCWTSRNGSPRISACILPCCIRAVRSGVQARPPHRPRHRRRPAAGVLHPRGCGHRHRARRAGHGCARRPSTMSARSWP